MRRWGVLGVLCLSLMLLGVDQTVLNVALPGMQRELRLGSAQLQWVVGAHMLALAAGVLAAGNWGDRRGRRTALLVGLTVCGLASVLGALAVGAEGIIAARALMGAGAAFIMPSTLSIVVEVFTDAGRQRLAITAWATVAGAGVLVGPVLGGWLLEYYSWQSCFWVNVPLVAVALVGVVLLVPPCRQDAAPAADPVGLLLSCAGLFAVVWALIQAPARGWSDATVMTAAVVGLALLVALIRWERRARAPMLPVELFRNRGYAVSAAALSLLFFTLVGSTFVLTFYLQGLRRMSPVEAGSTMLLGGAGVALGGLLSAAGARWTRPRGVLVAGMVLCGCAFVLLAGTTTDTAMGRLHAFLVVVGLGVGLAGGPATSLIMRAVPTEKAGIGAGMNDAVRSLGSTSGVAAIGSVFNTVYSARMSTTADGRTEAAPGAARDHFLRAVSEAEHLVATATEGDTAHRLHHLEQARRLVEDAEHAFVVALQTTSWACAGVCFAGACLVLMTLPAERRTTATPGSPTPVPPAAMRHGAGQ
ncbi:MFS transporter [Streptomyces syringium]|uniref:MFS transporter n=1 Tax=Streptomyces syringium TaxID=76729 RepID=UPI003433F4D3